MSDAVAALGGAQFEGLVTITEAEPRGMITLKGDLGAKALIDAASAVAGVGFPGPGEVRLAETAGLCWMAPDEILILTGRDRVPADLATLGGALAGTHHLAVDVSDARCLFVLKGPALREVLAKLTPADMRSDAFGPGKIRRTRLAQVPAAIWMRDEGSAEVVAFRSVARYVFDLLRTAADPAARVDYF